MPLPAKTRRQLLAGPPGFPDNAAMILLPESLKAWNSPDFKDVLKREVERLDSRLLPLQQGLSATSYVVDGKFSALIISVTDDPQFIHAKLGIFYSGIIAGCSCADDPTPVEPQTEYCELLLTIDKATAETSVALLAD